MSEVTTPPVRVVYFSGRTRNTDRFASRLLMPSYRIPQELEEEVAHINMPYVLITPTYGNSRGDNAVPAPVDQFLSYECHWRNLRGVIGSGNKNFGSNFGRAAHVISRQHRIPILHKFELFGMPSDITTSVARINQCLS